jgi:hypothetical protein
MAYELDLALARAQVLLADGPRSHEYLATHGLPLSSIKVLQRNGMIRPKMRPWLNREGKQIGAIEYLQLAPVSAPPPERLDCAVMDFAAMGIG